MELLLQHFKDAFNWDIAIQREVIFIVNTVLNENTHGRCYF